MTAEIKKRRFAEGVIVTNPTDLNVGSGGGGSGGVNLNINPNASLALDNSGTNDVGDWLDSGAGTTLSRETTTFPLGDTVTSAIKISFSAGTGDYSYIRFKVPESARNTRLGFFQYMLATGYTASTCKMEIYSYSDAYVTGEAEVALSTDDSSGDALLPNINGQFRFAFDADAREYYELRYINEGATSGSITLNEVTATPSLNVVSSVPISDWESYTPSNTQGFGTITTNLLQYRRVGDSVEIRGRFTAGTVAASQAQIELPLSITIAGAVARTRVGSWTRDAVSDTNMGTVLGTGGDTFIAFGNQNGGVSNPFNEINGNNVVANTQQFTLITTPIPIAEWAGSGNYYNGSSDPEYVYNTSTSTTVSDSTSFAYGTGGALVGAITADLERRVKFLSPIMPSDIIILQISADGKVWAEAGGLAGIRTVDNYRFDGTSNIGIGIQTILGNQDSVDVNFGQYRTGTTTSWNTTDIYWRVVKSRAGSLSGFGHATATQSGLVKKNKVQTKYLALDLTDNTVDIASMRFTGLTIGKAYSLSIYAFFNSLAAGNVNDSLVAKHNGITLISNAIAGEVDASDSNLYSAILPYFIATATSITFNYTDAGVSSRLIGDSSSTSETQATLIELNNYEETDEW